MVSSRTNKHRKGARQEKMFTCKELLAKSMTMSPADFLDLYGGIAQRMKTMQREGEGHDILDIDVERLDDSDPFEFDVDLTAAVRDSEGADEVKELGEEEEMKEGKKEKKRRREEEVSVGDSLDHIKYSAQKDVREVQYWSEAQIAEGTKSRKEAKKELKVSSKRSKEYIKE